MSVSDPHTEIREARELAEGCDVHGVGFICRHAWADLEGLAAYATEREHVHALEEARDRLAEATLAALARLEREAAERETALHVLATCDCVYAPISSMGCPKCGRQGTITAERWLEIVAQANRTVAAEARVREVEAERDTLKDAPMYGPEGRWKELRQRVETAEAAVARQEAALREIARAVLASPEFDQPDAGRTDKVNHGLDG